MLKFERGKDYNSVRRTIKSMPARTRRGIQKAFLKIRPELLNDTVKEMEKPKSGRKYLVYRGRNGRKLKKGRLHQASSRTEAPAVMTGALKKSLGFRIKRGSQLIYGANTPYARRWEQSARTYLWRTIKKKRMEIAYWFEEMLEKELRSIK